MRSSARGIALSRFAPILLLIAIACIASGQPDAATARIVVPSAGDVRGDTDCGGTVDSIDALQVLRTTAGLNSAAGCIESAGDTDCDTDVDSTDALRILRHVASLSVTTPLGCSELGMPVELGPTSGELIDAALAAGDIDDDDAFLYRVFAAFGDGRLPVEYRGAPGGVDGVSALLRDAGELDTLSPNVADTIAPFLLPPNTPGNWMELQQPASLSAAGADWESLSGERVKVWWHADREEDAEKADAVLSELEGTIWPALVGLMGETHAPPSDAAQANGGGDGLFDVYLAHIDANMLGYVSPMSGCEQTPSFMVINSTQPLTPELFSTVAHEFMHAIQFSYDVGSCDDYRWMFESTAMWAEHYVYPDLNAEHGYAPPFLETLSEPLEKYAYMDPRPYGTYLFFLYLYHKFDYPGIVADIWNESGNPDSLYAIQQATSSLGGFRELWAEFSLFNWNRDSIDEYREWDEMSHTAPFNSTVVGVTGSGATHIPIADTLKHLSARHQHFFFDEAVRTVTFMNPFAGMDDPAVKVQALIRDEEGGWREVEDWTDQERVHFCRDKADENIAELVLVLSSSEYSDRTEVVNPIGETEIVASGTGCKGWTGTLSAEVIWRGAVFTTTVNDVLFVESPTLKDPNGRFEYYEFKSSGPIVWHASGVWNDECPVLGGEMHHNQPDGTNDDDSNTMHGGLHTDNEEGTHGLSAGAHDFDAKFTVQCPETDPFEISFPVIPVASAGHSSENHPTTLEGGENVAESSYHTEPTEYDWGGTWSWRLVETE